MLLFDGYICGDSLCAVRCDGAIVTGTAVIEEDISIPCPEFVADRVEFILPEKYPPLIKINLITPKAGP